MRQTTRKNGFAWRTWPVWLGVALIGLAQQPAWAGPSHALVVFGSAVQLDGTPSDGLL